MGLKSFLGSKRTRQLSALSMLVQAGSALKKGNVKLALLYVAGAAVSYKNSAAGFLAQVGLRLLGRRGSSKST